MNHHREIHVNRYALKSFEAIFYTMEREEEEEGERREGVQQQQQNIENSVRQASQKKRRWQDSKQVAD